jgi:4'-phosphopantetheinyl transferase
VRDAAIAFNLSHSGPSVAIALRAGADTEARLGVDVQQSKTTDELALARSLFADSEIAMLAGLGKAERHDPFFRLWACREAVLKASGLGMKGRGFELRQDAHGTYAVRALSPVWTDITLHEFQPHRNVFGALAWRQVGGQAGPRPQIRQFAI